MSPGEAVSIRVFDETRFDGSMIGAEIASGRELAPARLKIDSGERYSPPPPAGVSMLTSASMSASSPAPPPSAPLK